MFYVIFVSLLVIPVLFMLATVAVATFAPFDVSEAVETVEAQTIASRKVAAEIQLRTALTLREQAKQVEIRACFARRYGRAARTTADLLFASALREQASLFMALASVQVAS